MPKFGWLHDGKNEEHYEYPNIWARESTTGPERLVIAPRSSQIELLQTLCRCLEGPFGFLYVLIVPRTKAKAGRYQNEKPWAIEELTEFLDTFRDFFEQDGRHNIWIGSNDGGLLVYDRHQLIYAYGPLDCFTSTLLSNGLIETGEVLPPLPHIHSYNETFDEDQRRITQNYRWKITPLRKGDENPNE